MGFRIRSRSTSSGTSISAGGSSNAGGGCLILFGLVFAGFGFVFIVLSSKEVFNELKTYRWTKTPCEIERCEIRVDRSRDDDRFQLEVSYSYSIRGQSRSSDRYTLQKHWSGDYEKLALKRKALLSSANTVCYVDPEMMSRAVMKREGDTRLLLMLLPLIFIVIGGGIVWGGICALRKKKNLQEGKTESISSRAGSSKKAGWVFMIIFGGVFALVGAGVGIPLGIMPIKKMMDSRNWVETPCKIIWSRVQRHESTNDGHTSITWSVDIFYEYAFNGETHRSNKFGAISSSSSGRSGKVAITKKYPTGSQQSCFVNPKVPEQALL